MGKELRIDLCFTMRTCSWNWAVTTLVLCGGLNVNASIAMKMSQRYCAIFGCVDCGTALNNTAYAGQNSCFSCDGDPVSDATIAWLARDKVIVACCNWGTNLVPPASQRANRCQKFDGQLLPGDTASCIDSVYQMEPPTSSGPSLIASGTGTFGDCGDVSFNVGNEFTGNRQTTCVSNLQATFLDIKATLTACASSEAEYAQRRLLSKDTIDAAAGADMDKAKPDDLLSLMADIGRPAILLRLPLQIAGPAHNGFSARKGLGSR